MDAPLPMKPPRRAIDRVAGAYGSRAALPVDQRPTNSHAPIKTLRFLAFGENLGTSGRDRSVVFEHRKTGREEAVSDCRDDGASSTRDLKLYHWRVFQEILPRSPLQYLEFSSPERKMGTGKGNPCPLKQPCQRTCCRHDTRSGRRSGERRTSENSESGCGKIVPAFCRQFDYSYFKSREHRVFRTPDAPLAPNRLFARHGA